MSLRSLPFILALLPTLALAQGAPAGTTPPVVNNPEIDIHTPGGKDAKSPAVPKGRPLRIGVVPSLGQGADKESQSLADYLSKQMGQKVEGVLFENHDAQANALVAGRIDFAWMPPFQAFNAEMGGAKILAKLTRKGASTYRSVLFVRDDSSVKKLADLKNAKVGWVEANSATGHLFPLAVLAHEKLTPSQLFKEQVYLGNHDAVCKAVWDKKVDIGATLADEPVNNAPIHIDGCVHSLGKNADKLRVVAVSEPVPNDVIAVRSGLDPKITAKLREVVLALPQSDAGKGILKSSLKADGVTDVKPGDFDPVQHALEAAAEVDGK